MICHSCGGVVGRDCFNTQECEQITRQMAEEYQSQQNIFQQYEREISQEAKASMSDSIQIRKLIESHPLDERDNSPRWASPLNVGRDTALLKLEGPLVYATEGTAAMLWDNLASGSFWNEMTPFHGHKLVFLSDRLPTVVRLLQMRGKQVLIV